MTVSIERADRPHDERATVDRARRTWLARTTSVGAMAVGAAAAASLSGCSLFSSSRPKPAPLPVLKGHASLTVVWSHKVGSGGIGFEPAVVGDTLLAASARGRVYRIDVATGKELWQVDLDRKLLSGVGADDKVVVVAARDGTVIALDPNGKPKWTASVGSEAVAVPAVGEGAVLVRTSSNRIYAFDAQTGHQRWMFTRQNPPLVLHQTSLITIDAGVAYVGAPGGRLIAIGMDNGAVRWESSVSQPRGSNEIERIADVVGATPVKDSQVCASSYQGRLACFDAASGRPLWTRDVPSSTGVAMDSGIVAVTDSEDQVHAFSQTGSSLWRNQQFKLRDLSSPLITDDGVIVADGNGLVHALDRDDGAAIARASTDGSAIVSVPLKVGSMIVLQTSAGGVYALRLQR